MKSQRDMDLGNRIRALRKARGWNRKELASMCGVGYHVVSIWEVGGHPPDLSEMGTLATVFGITRHELRGTAQPVHE